MNETTRQEPTGGPRNERNIRVGVFNHNARLAATPDPSDHQSRLAMFRELAAVHAEMAAIGAEDLHESVDRLQDLAEQWGLIRAFGQDQIQRHMAEAFDLEAVR